MAEKFISYAEIDEARHFQDYDLETIEHMVSWKIKECIPCTINCEDGYLIKNS